MLKQIIFLTILFTDYSAYVTPHVLLVQKTRQTFSEGYSSPQLWGHYWATVLCSAAAVLGWATNEHFIKAELNLERHMRVIIIKSAPSTYREHILDKKTGHLSVKVVVSLRDLYGLPRNIFKFMNGMHNIYILFCIFTNVVESDVCVQSYSY